MSRVHLRVLANADPRWVFCGAGSRMRSRKTPENTDVLADVTCLACLRAVRAHHARLLQEVADRIEEVLSEVQR